MAKVAIGLPVFNGEEHLPAALDSLRAQTFGEFDLIILDNASTDSTGEIGRKAAQEDKRIRYSRNSVNIGAAKNFNRVFRMSNSEYFKWAAHDDICAPRFLEETLQVLENDESAILAFPKAVVLDEATGSREPYDPRLNTDAADIPERFGSVIKGHKCFEVFGLIRSAVLRRTKLIGSYVSGDVVLLAELSLHGRFIEIEESLFLARKHSEQSMRMLKDPNAYASWFDPTRTWSGRIPRMNRLFEQARAVVRTQLGWKVKKQCYKHLYWEALSKRSLLRREVVDLLPFSRNLPRAGRGK